MAAPGLGRDFRALWAANSVSTLGDGMVAAAAPLLVASVSDDPVLIGLAVFVQQLPWLLFALVSGAVIDRLDKRRLIVAVDVSRGLLTGVLTLAVWWGHASIPVIYAVAFLLGTCETLAETAASTLVPAVVAPELLPSANSRLHGSYFVLNKFAGRPAGASLFVLAAALPFGLDAASFLVSALLVATMRGVRAPAGRPGPDGPAPADGPGPARSIRADIRDGLRWLWREPVIRMLTLALCLMNVTLTAGFSIMVLYARDRLGLGDIGYGFLLAASAVGGILGALLAPRLQSWFRASVLLRAGLVVETLTHVGLALAGTAAAAFCVLVAFGVHSSVFAGIETTFRQRRVPEELRGRVGSVFMMFAIGGNAVGALIGGPLVSWRGVAAPFWFSAVAMTAVTALCWRPFGRNLPAAAGGAAVGAGEAEATGGAGAGGPAPGTASGEAYPVP
ncbi:Predicted arabinose efflux permease, MFS family [Streptomyces sp. DvalAA-14]|uniref:MFS transporter n=1 Tax=unclassified Streptomyces TaxID=2593676 RepID=UPI00081B60B1|nr:MULTISPECIES: MFS transporter [unclassified Streptomyces]MYS24730.1 MFS transporter [Streptomyces sp. SID4948]SCE48886.1 Predicted arabinose efflux permease, MFS family [Streptomyces sp. DvalAA-14]